jgi:hypothetical protein
MALIGLALVNFSGSDFKHRTDLSDRLISAQGIAIENNLSNKDDLDRIESLKESLSRRAPFGQSLLRLQIGFVLMLFSCAVLPRKLYGG